METGKSALKRLLAVRRTDPTYKEWKRCANALHASWLYRTDPTYKEWKRPSFPKDIIPALLRTDPTYKEWKPALRRGLDRGLEPHGSYLQGMETV